MFAALASALGLAACEGCRSTGTTRPSTPARRARRRPSDRAPLLRHRPCGGARAVRLHEGPAGRARPLRRMGESRAARRPGRARGSAGPLFFMDDKLEGDRADQDRIKAQTIARVLARARLRGVRPGKERLGRRGGRRSPSSRRTRARDGPRTTAGPTRSCARSAACGWASSATGRRRAAKAAATNVEDAVRRGVEDAKKQGAEVLVALAAVGRGEAKRIADAVPELTAVVVGSARSDGRLEHHRATRGAGGQRPHRPGRPTTCRAWPCSTSTCAIRWCRVISSKFADGTGLELAEKREELTRRIDELHVEIAGLGSAIPRSRPADVAARRRSSRASRRSSRRSTRSPPPRRGASSATPSRRCAPSLGEDPTVEADMRVVLQGGRRPQPRRLRRTDCRRPRARSGHVHRRRRMLELPPGPARGLERDGARARVRDAVEQFKEFNLECVELPRHRLRAARGQHGHPRRQARERRCEVCHGPGSKHALDPTRPRRRIIARPDASALPHCHHPPHVEGFDATAKMKEILGSRARNAKWPRAHPCRSAEAEYRPTTRPGP